MEFKLTLTDIKSYIVSGALASAVLFGYGQHPTVDAIIVTVVWIFLVAGFLAMVMLTAVLVAIRKSDERNNKEFGKFYDAISKMHKNVLGRIIGFGMIAYWLYALIAHEWTATAVFYVITVVYIQFFIYATKDVAKTFFVDQLKGTE